jgi:hypothetical protein
LSNFTRKFNKNSFQVLTPELFIKRGGTAEVQLQFTIPFIVQNLVIGQDYDEVSDLHVNLAVLNESSISCNDKKRKFCGISVKGYRFKDRGNYSTDIWKQNHTITVYNRDNGDYTDFDRHITLRLETSEIGDRIYGNGSKIFSNIALPDIQASKQKI